PVLPIGSRITLWDHVFWLIQRGSAHQRHSHQGGGGGDGRQGDEPDGGDDERDVDEVHVLSCISARCNIDTLRTACHRDRSTLTSRRSPRSACCPSGRVIPTRCSA